MKLKTISVLSLLFLVFFFNPKNVSAKNSLFFDPASVQKSKYEVFPINIVLQTTESVVAADIDISYDPKAISINQITPGDFFENPLIVTNQIDGVGHALFSLYSQKGKIGSGTLLIIFVKLISETNSPTNITIEPSSLIAGENGKKLVVTFSQARIIPVSPTAGPSVPPTSYLSPVPTFAASEPTITIEGQITPTPIPKKSNFTSILIVFIIIIVIVGSGAYIFLKKTL